MSQENVFSFDKEYSEIPEEVKKIMTEDEFDTIINLQKSFIESAKYVNQILRNDDVETNLNYIIRDWFGENDGRGFRNDELLHWLSKINRVLKKSKAQEFFSVIPQGSTE